MPYAFAAVLAVTEGAESAADHSNPLIPHTNELIWGAISFALFFLVFSKFVFPRAGAALKERTENIEGKLERAEFERAEAARLLQEYQLKLQEAQAEARTIVDTARSNADRLEAERRASAEEQANRIVAQAQQTIAAERDRALASLRNEVGTLVVELTSRVLNDSLDRDRQLKLVDSYIEDLNKSSVNS